MAVIAIVDSLPRRFAGSLAIPGWTDFVSVGSQLPITAKASIGRIFRAEKSVLSLYLA